MRIPFRIILLLAGLLAVACSSKTGSSVVSGQSVSPGTQAVATPPAASPKATPVAEMTSCPPSYPTYVKDIFFDFDSAHIRPDGRETLERNAEMLLQHPTLQVTIEGHCDERGTSQYNLALGQRRAEATKAFLVASGVQGDRLTAISYGRERPFAIGQSEEAYAKNRRAHFVFTRG